LILTIIF